MTALAVVALGLGLMIFGAISRIGNELEALRKLWAAWYAREGQE